MSIARTRGQNAAETRRMIRDARALVVPAGWTAVWILEMVEGFTPDNQVEPTEGCGSTDFDSLDQAIVHFRHMRKRVRARLIAKLISPTAGRRFDWSPGARVLLSGNELQH
jgi:hypothetical protein